MVQSVDRALQIINLVSQTKEGRGVTELAASLDLNKSSIYKILSTLVNHGYIEQNVETKKYRLGYKYLELSSILLDSIDIRKEAKPFLEELESLTNEVIHLVVFDQGEVIYIEKLEGSETLRTHSKVGRRAPMHCTSVGKVILSFLPEDQVIAIIEKFGLPKHTENTITDKVEFLAALGEIKKQGYGMEIEENEAGISCMATPVFDNRGEITAAVSISGPSTRLTKMRMESLSPFIKEIGKKISKRLGYIQTS
ncbi:IclR family transcriptional regulator [Halalkalibacter akibai]|uniref:Glycerol operon regulatory protein n=1 Tax=Halalkalibacter akibai (strain ATCC 43226 / DSM 21942 / CIP 109018 / JCM 9157 / 1139) TaxID=1236973 RepID=W4QTM5_HALA3|nr:IclR family transcriptional regulator [Halalkalibacter akibai]GAE35277.1 transcriptional regulator [Halalkalibacter akibai JCM 9157]